MHILILGHGRDMPAEIKAVDPDVRLSVLCPTSAVRKVRRPDLVATIVGMDDAGSAEDWLTMARALHRIEPIDSVGAFGEWHQDLAAAIGADLGAKAHNRETIDLVHNKGRMRQRLLELGVDQVHYTVVESTEQAVAAVANAGTPCIVKPLDGVGSRGVSLVRSAEEVSPAYDRAAGTDHSWPVIVETYLEGPEFSVEMLVANGQCHPIAITAKYTDSQSFVEIGHVVPAPLATGIEELIYSFCSAVVSALGIERGATHTEVILTDEGPHCVETHVRLGGDDIPRLVEDAASVRLERELAREIIGREYSTEALASPPPARRAAAIWFVPAAGTGILKSVEGIDSAKALEGVQAVDMLLPAGTSVNGIASSHDRIVAVRAVGPDPQTALHRAQAAAETLTVTMDGLPALNIVTA